MNPTKTNPISVACVVYTQYLMDDSGTRFPEAYSVLGCSSGQEAVYLLIHILGGNGMGQRKGSLISHDNPSLRRDGPGISSR